MFLKSFVFSPDQGTMNVTKPPRFSPVKNLTMIDCSASKINVVFI